MFSRLLLASTRKYHSVCVGMDLTTLTTALKNFAPTSLAGSWDNVGLLIEPTPPHQVHKMILTNDLTEAVMEEAISEKVNMILSYHPPIFSPLKRLTQGRWKERIVIKCIENRIALYSPHTSYDAVEGGVNDWLIAPFGGDVKPIQVVHEAAYSTVGKYKLEASFPADEADSCTQVISALAGVELISTHWGEHKGAKILRLSANSNSDGLTSLVKYISQNPSAKSTIEITELQKAPIPNQGAGRVSRLKEGISLSKAVEMVKSHLKLPHVRLAKAVGSDSDAVVRSVAVCAGSGSSVLAGVHADLYITGEMSHHEVLDAVQTGHSVILCDHSNTERGYLSLLQTKLTHLLGGQVDIVISARDADPLQVV